jgi:hypothetical protein
LTAVPTHLREALTAYNLIRLEMAKAALEVKCEPTEISFIRAFHVIQYEPHWAAVTRAQGKLPSLLQRLRQRLVSLIKEERPDRHFDRAVKALPKLCRSRPEKRPRLNGIGPEGGVFVFKVSTAFPCAARRRYVVACSS